MMTNAMKEFSLDDLHLARPSKQGAALRDYDSVRRAIGFISEQWRTQLTGAQIQQIVDAHREQMERFGYVPEGY